MPERLFTTNQVAELLGATPREVLEWIRRGWLPYQRLPDGPVRITERGLIQFLKGRGIDIMQLMVSTAVHEGESQGPRPAARAARAAAPPPPSEEETLALLTATREPAPDRREAEPPQAETAEDFAARVLLAAPARQAGGDATAAADQELPPLIPEGPEAVEGPEVEEMPGHAERALVPAEAEELPAPEPAPARAEQATQQAEVRGEPAPAEAQGEPAPAEVQEEPAAAEAAPASRATEAAGATEAQTKVEDEPVQEAEARGGRGPVSELPAEGGAEPVAEGEAPFAVEGEGEIEIEPEEAPADAAEQVAQAVLEDAVEHAASHIHLEQRPEGPALRLRIDGVLRDKPSFARHLPDGLAPRLVRRLLTWAGLDGEGLSRPQAGRFTRAVAGREVGFHLSSLPAENGPRLVVAVYDRDVPAPDLPQLGLGEEACRRLADALLSAGGGLVLVTGPLPKATCAALGALAAAACEAGRAGMVLDTAAGVNLPGACPVRLDPLGGWGFADAARAALDQDADVLVIGQLRDPRVSAAALEAALAGSMVLAGLRSPDVPEALEELAEMGVDPWPLASALRAVLAFRTVRSLCVSCRRAVAPPAELPARLRLSRGELGERIAEPMGCERCGQSGYAGTAALASVLVPDRAVVRAIRERASGEALAAACRQAGARPVRDLAGELLRAGTTSVQEVLGIL